MSEFGQQIIFKELLDKHGRVQVPLIQRDYAQGRESESEVRDEFLQAIHETLVLPADDASLPLNLDFIYGSVEGNEETRFLPLDGQQRLTTLFLLHWYLAWVDGDWEGFSHLLCTDNSSRFSYQVRPSSSEFFDALVRFQPKESVKSEDCLSGLIGNQSWYFRNWRLDPTIQASLRMLDSIHHRFRESKGLYQRITDTESPAITFQLLNLKNFGLSDDLYIKMNARGKPLTAFETFKARFEEVLARQFVGESLSIGSENLTYAEFFSRRIDTAWADFFWGYRNNTTNLFDEAVMNLFRTVALITRDPESETYANQILELRKSTVKSTYSVFERNGWLDRKFCEELILLLEAWSKNGTNFTRFLPDARYFDEILQFKNAVNAPTDFGYAEIIQFIGYNIYLREHADASDPGEFQEWMRVVFNLSANTSYDRPADLQRSVSALLELGPNSGNILQFFATTEDPVAGFNAQQIAEEKLKAELILADTGWRTLIDRAEGHDYFKGQAEFLLDFCGALEYWRNDGNVNWEPKVHASLQEQFETYLEKAEKMFNSRGLVDLGEYRWERALLSIGDYLLPSGSNFSFLVNSSTEPASWKRLLRGTGPKVLEARRLLQQLLDRISADDSLIEQLDKIIEDATGLELWRLALVRTPEAIAYCDNRAIRRNSADSVYLLKKRQMNGEHAELYTYCLFHNQLVQMAQDGVFKPLTLDKTYYSTYETGIEPGVRFTWSRDEYSLIFELEWGQDSFVIFVNCDSLVSLPDVKKALCETAGFTETELTLKRKTDSNDILDALKNLRLALAGVSGAR